MNWYTLQHKRYLFCIAYLWPIMWPSGQVFLCSQHFKINKEPGGTQFLKIWIEIRVKSEEVTIFIKSTHGILQRMILVGSRWSWRRLLAFVSSGLISSWNHQSWVLQTGRGKNTACILGELCSREGIMALHLTRSLLILLSYPFVFLPNFFFYSISLS